MKQWRQRDFWLTLLITLFLGWVANHLLDFTAVGTLRLWSRVLGILSLGSAAVRDAPFESAALNAYPIPGLALMAAGLSLLFGITLFIGLRVAELYLRYRRRRKAGPGAREIHDSPEVIERKMKWGFAFFWLMLPIMLLSNIGLLIPASTVSEAVLARRIYEADRDRIAPYLSPAELTQLQADFAGVETKSDYVAVMDRIAAVAEAHHTKIHPYK
jgi:hypothetical protein